MNELCYVHQQTPHRAWFRAQTEVGRASGGYGMHLEPEFVSHQRHCNGNKMIT